jgi:hypothetical protein
MSMHLIDEVEAYNQVQAEEYRRLKPSRDTQRKKIGINLDLIGCADGRFSAGYAFNVLPGIINEHPTIGAIADPGWPQVSRQLYQSYKWCISQRPKIRSAFMSTYHYSSGGHGNCAGHSNDTDAAIRSAFTLRSIMAEICDPDFYLPIVVGFDTDNDGITFHSLSGQPLSVLDYTSCPDKLANNVRELYRDCHKKIAKGLAWLAASNLRHAKHFLEHPRSQEQVSHNENGIIVGVGAGVSNCFPRDKILRVGAYADDITEPLAKAAEIIAHNRDKGSTPAGQRALLLVNGVYFEESGPDALFAKRQAVVLAEKAKGIVLNVQPQLEEELDIAAGTVYHHDRSLTIFNRSV